MITLTTSYQLIKQTYLGNNGYGGDIYVRTYAKYSTQDIANNTTTMQVQTRIYSGSPWWASSGTGHTTTANGVTKSGMNLTYDWSMWAVGETTIETLETTVQHTNDGTKSLSVSSYFYSEPWGWYGTAEDTVALPTIPRASKLTSATMTIANNGGSITVKPKLTKNVNTFYDCLVIQDNGTTIVTLDGVTNNTNKSLSSSQITTVFNSIGTETNKTFTCYLETYSDNTKATLIGNSTSVNLTATLPTYNISITASVEDTVTAYNTYKGSGNANKVYIANLSKPKFTFSASSSTGSYYGRSVAFTLNDSAVTSPYTVNNYTGQSFTLKATDGRKNDTNSPTMTPIAYFTPTLQTTVTRTTPTGSTIDIQVSGTYYSGTGLTNLATPTLTLKYTQSGGSEQTTTILLTATTSGDVVTFTGTKQLTGMNYQKSVAWNTTISDKLGVTQTNSNVLSRGLPVWNAYIKNDTNYFNVNGNANVTEAFTATTLNGYQWDTETNNTTDTWIPVFNGSKIQHRVLNTDLNNRYVKSLTSKSHTNFSSDSNKLPDISMISYWNGAYNSSNSSNLTYAHQGIIQCKPTSLYDNATGVTGNVTLSQTASNFNYLEIFYYGKIGGNDWYQSMRVFSPNNKKVALITANGLSNAMAIGVHTMTISGTSITNNYNGTYASFGSPGGTDEVYVYKVLGWK